MLNQQQMLNKQTKKNAKQKTEAHKQKKKKKLGNIYIFLKIFISSLVIDFIIFIHIFYKQI